MSLYLFDFGRFDNFSHALDRKKNYKESIVDVDNNCSEIPNNSELHSGEQEMDDCIPPIESQYHSHEHSTSRSKRHMSVPQLPRNASVVKVREQRITSVVGIPHRHHITIAVNDEPVDIIKTTCTGPCLESCGSNYKLRKVPSSKTKNYQNGAYTDSDPQNQHNTTNLLTLTLIYVISTISVRSIITLYTTLYGTTSFKRKLTLSIIYFSAAISVAGFSLNPLTSNIKSWSIRMRLLLSLLLLIVWSGFHLIPIMPWYVTMIMAAVLGVAISMFWDSTVQLLFKWSQIPFSKTNIDSLNDVTSRTNILPMTNVISHSMHIWTNILLFIVLEAISTDMSFGRKPSKADNIKSTQINSSNLDRGHNLTKFCGFMGDYSDNDRWQEPGQIMFYLQYVCISLNVIAIILVVLLFDKSRSTRIPSNSVNKNPHQSLNNNYGNQNSSLIESSDANDNIHTWLMIDVRMWGKAKSSTVMEIWRFQRTKYILPSLLTMGLVEGFFVTDYNERFVSCFHKPSFIGISMLTFALSVVIFVNVFQIIKMHTVIEIISFPISRTLIFLSSLTLALTNVGQHWSYLLIFYPSIMGYDAIICLIIFYVHVANLPGHLADNSVAIHRILRLLGVAIYILISGLAGPLVASVTTVIAHCFLSPAIILLARFWEKSKL